MRTSFIPSTDMGLLSWAQNFSARINVSYASLGLTLAQTEQYAAAFEAYAAALQKCNPGERSKSLVAAKNDAREELKVLTRSFAGIVKSLITVSDSEKLELGLKIPSPKTSVPRPDAAPALSVVETIGRSVKVRANDLLVGGRARPPGAKGVTILSCVGTSEPDRIELWRVEQSSTSRTIMIHFPNDLPPGTQVWLAARWFNTKCEPGPVSNPITTYLSGGGMFLKQAA
jgi:hypothetical protein